MRSYYHALAPALIRNGPVFVLLAAVATWWVSKRLIKTGVFTLREAIVIVWRYLFSSRNFRNTIVAGVVASFAITRVSSFAAHAFRQDWETRSTCTCTEIAAVPQALDPRGVIYHDGGRLQLYQQHRRGLCQQPWVVLNSPCAFTLRAEPYGDMQADAMEYSNDPKGTANANPNPTALHC